MPDPTNPPGPDATPPNATQTAMDAIGAPPAPDAPSAPPAPPAPPADKPAEPPKPDEPARQEDGATRSPAAKALLDALTDDPNRPANPPKPAQDGAPASAAPPAAAKPGDPPEAPKPPAGQPGDDPELTEMLEGVRSDRGKERVKAMFGEKKRLETDMGEFRTLVQNTGMDPAQFASSLEFGRLVNSGKPQDLQVALEMLEGQRKEIYSRMGVEAPGVDLLADQPDLKQSVDDMEITRERALELAKLRKQTQQRDAQTADANARQQSQQQYEASVKEAGNTMNAYLASRAQEADHPIRMKVLQDYFAKPENMQNFVSKYAPNQWLDTVRLFYDNVAVQPRAPVNTPQPLRSRPSQLGAPLVAGEEPIDRMAKHMDALGL